MGGSVFGHRAAPVNSMPPPLATAIPMAPDHDSESRIRNLIGFHEQLLGDLHGAISALESRLDTALVPDGTKACTAVSDAGPSPAPPSPLLERIAMLNGAVEQAIDRLRSLRWRVDL